MFLPSKFAFYMPKNNGGGGGGGRCTDLLFCYRALGDGVRFFCVFLFVFLLFANEIDNYAAFVMILLLQQ